MKLLPVIQIIVARHCHNCRLDPGEELFAKVPNKGGISTATVKSFLHVCPVKMPHVDPNDNTRKFTSFKQKKPLATRKEEVAAIRVKFPSKVPVIVERFHKEMSLPSLDKTKFLVPQEITMSQFITIIRNRLQLNSQQALYLLVSNRNLASLSRPLAQIYRDYRDEDGFLYVTYASQEVFG